MFRRLLQAGLLRIAARVCAFLFLLTADNGFSSKVPVLSPERQIDLSFLGKVVEPPLNRLVEFVDQDTLAVAFVVHNPRPPKLVRRGEFDENSAFSVHVALLNAHSGQTLIQADWPTDFPRHSGIVAATNSGLLVLLGNRVALYSDNLKLQEQVQLPGNDREVWVGRASPSGRNALFIQDAGLKPATWAWVNATQLRVLRIWRNVPPEPGGQGSPVSDRYITYIRCLPPGGRPPCTLTAQALNGEMLRRVGGINLRYGPPEFVGDSLILVRGWPGDISIVNLAKKHVIRRRSPGFIGSVLGLPASAPDVSRFVVPAFSRDHVLQYLDVFDGPTAHLHVFRVPGLPPAGHSPWLVTLPSGVSLAPDGRLLAVMENFHTLLIFKLPPPEGH